MTVDIYKDYVMFEGKRIDRPSHIAPSDWIDWWEHATLCDGG